MSARVLGVHELSRQLDRLKAQVDAQSKAMASVARKAFKPVLDEAKALAPRDTGELADSIKMKTERPKSGDAAVKVGLTIGRSGRARQASVASAAFGEGQSKALPAARRWHFVELGTAHEAAQPFLRPALDRRSSEVMDVIRAELRAEIDRAVRG